MNDSGNKPLSFKLIGQLPIHGTDHGGCTGVRRKVQPKNEVPFLHLRGNGPICGRRGAGRDKGSRAGKTCLGGESKSPVTSSEVLSRAPRRVGEGGVDWNNEEADIAALPAGPSAPSARRLRAKASRCWVPAR
ncbi:hypothetical protein ACOMHN_053608 [Nucella lapillus]